MFFAILSIVGPYFARIASANNAWEERLQEKRRQIAEETGEEISDLEFYRQSVKTYPSMYGSKGKLREKERRAREALGYEEDSGDERRGRGKSGSNVEERFEREYGVEYDPFYDEPYAEDELPADLRFTKTAFGDRIYENGEAFFKSGDVWYRRGSKPRMKFFWSKEDDDDDDDFA